MSLDSDYAKWQAQFQPEENGRVHGGEGIPEVDDDVSDWEERVCEATGAGIEQIKQAFHGTEQDLSEQFGQVVATYHRHRASYQEKSSVLGRDISIPVSKLWNLVLSTLIAVAACFFVAVLMTHVFDGVAIAIASGILLALGLCVASYLCGIVVRQVSDMRYRGAALGCLLLILVLLIWIASSAAEVAGAAPVIAAAISGLLISIAMPLVAGLARDQDASLQRYWISYQKDLKKVAELQSMREENQRRSISVAQQLVHNGRRTIRVYRDTNVRYRLKVGKPEPAFFNVDPDIPDVTSADFPLEDDNAYEATP